MSPAGKPQGPLVALSTASVFPDRTPDAFEVAARLGYDGIEVMVSADAVSQDVDVLRRLVDYHGIPVLAIHAPCLLVTQRVWGREPWGKLIKSKAVAETLGARVVVVHPPFRWQRDYAREFTAGLERMREETDVVFAVENMYPLRAGGAEVAPYSPHWNPVPQDYPSVTLDLSHTSVSGSDALAMAGELGGRLAHIHLADGTGVTNRDEHLVPGRGAQPCAPLLHKLAAEGYTGTVVLEVNTRRASSREARRADLAEALEFTRRHLAPGGEDGPALSGVGGTAPASQGAASGTSQGGTSQGQARQGGTSQGGTSQGGASQVAGRRRGPAGRAAAAGHSAGNGHQPAGTGGPASDSTAGNGTARPGTLGNGSPGDGTPGDGSPGDGTPGDGTPGDGSPGDGSPGDGSPGGPAADGPGRRVAGRARSLGRAVSRPVTRAGGARNGGSRAGAGQGPFLDSSALGRAR